MSEPQPAGVFQPVAAETGKPIELAMQRLYLVGRILGVGARLLVKHTFRSGEKKPLEVIYSFGLPRDAALRRFRITGQGFSVSSDLRPVEKAVEVYEQGLAEGHLAAMARTYRDGLVNLTVGNIRPGEEVTVNLEIIAGVETRDDGLRFRFPFTLAPAYHSKARAAEVAPGVGEIELPADEFGDLVLPQFAADATALHEVGFDLSVSVGHPIVETASPSHAVRVVGQGIGRSRVSLATAKDLPDRDLVLDVRTGESLAGVVGGTGRDGRGYFAAVVPSAAFRNATQEAVNEEPRRVVFVIDRSGSMGGAPMEQARKAVEACLGALAESDRFGIVAFDDGVESFDKCLVEASMENRERAREFLGGIDARGGTELAAGFRAAAAMLRGGADGGGGGDLIIVTDGQVMGTERILEQARAAGVRLHCLGIGSASQDRFLALLARETGGISRFLTTRERVDLGAVELFAAVGRPLASGLEAGMEGFQDGRVAPEPQGFVFDGSPVVLFGDTAGPGEGRLALSFEAGGSKRTLDVPLAIGPGGDGETVRLLQGARLITDLESRYLPYGEAAEKRETERIKKRLVALGEAYGLANREMALVAVVERPGDRRGDIPKTTVVPVGLPQDVEMGAYFSRSQVMHAAGPVLASMAMPSDARMVRGRFTKGRASERVLYDMAYLTAANELEDSDAGRNPLIDLAASLEPDGGLPGSSEEERVQATILALLRFLAAGHSTKIGAFRVHVKKMVKFLEKSKLRPEIVRDIVERAKSGRALPGEWEKKAPGPDLWDELEKAVRQA